MGRSAKFKKLSEMGNLHSPSSNLAFSESFSMLSDIECLGLISVLAISINKYKFLQNFLLSKSINVFARYESLLSFKKSIIPASLSITENSAIIPIADILKNSLTSLLDFSTIDCLADIQVYVKFGVMA